MIVSAYGIGLDGLLNFYADWKSINENEISEAFILHTNWQNNLAYPLLRFLSEVLTRKFNVPTFFKGITATAPSFYGPEGRQI